MRRPAVIGAWVLLAVACRTSPQGGEPAPVETFTTERCQAASLPPARPRPAGRFAFEDWAPPARPALSLLDAPATFTGDAPGDAGVLVRWTGADLAAWVRTRDERGWRVTAPGWDAPILGAEALRVVVAPGPMRRLAIVVSPKKSVDRRERGMRTVSFTLDPAADPGEALVLTADLRSVLGGNWGDDVRGETGLGALELYLEVDDPDRVQVLEIAVLARGQVYSGAGAGRVVADVDGALRPAFYTHGGASVRVRVTLPEDPVRLVWHDGVDAGTATRVVRVLAGDRTEDLFRYPGAVTGWPRQRAPLAAFAGQPVEIELTSEGDGVGLFGAPHLVPDEGRGKVPNIVLYMIDTLRADHLGAWGNPQPGITPAMDRLAAEGAAFGFAITTSPWTKPAIPTLMSGLNPTTHLVGAHTYADRLPESVVTLADRLHEAGWRTGSFSSNPLGSTLSGLEQGFDLTLPPEHWRGHLGALRHPDADQLHEAMLAFAREDPDTPFFAYVHTLEVHAWRRSLYARSPTGLTSYDAAVQDADAKVGRLRAALEAAGLAEDTLVVLLSDHGESFGDHGVKEHGTGLYQSQVHIPLVFWAGGALPAMTVTEPVSLADVAPTILDLVGAAPLPDADGRSLAPFLRGEVATLHQQVPAARIRYVWRPQEPPIYAAVARDGRKLVVQGETKRAFDLSADLCETRTTGWIPLDLQGWLDGFLAGEGEKAAAFEARHVPGGAAVDAEHVEQLRSLGYVE